jgi:hypothetical protein
MTTATATLDHNELYQMFAEIGTSFIGMDTTTIPVTVAGSPLHNKSGKKCKCPEVYKHATFTGFIMGDARGYEKRVNTKASKELAAIYGDDVEIAVPFKAEALWYGAGRHGIGANVYHAKSGRQYVCMFCDVARNAPQVSYTDRYGQPVPAEKVIEREHDDEKFVDIGHGIMVAVTLKYRIVAFDSIDRIRIDGQEYEIEHPVPEQVKTTVTVGQAFGEDIDADSFSF